MKQANAKVEAASRHVAVIVVNSNKQVADDCALHCILMAALIIRLGDMIWFGTGTGTD